MLEVPNGQVPCFLGAPCDVIEALRLYTSNVALQTPQHFDISEPIDKQLQAVDEDDDQPLYELVTCLEGHVAGADVYEKDVYEKPFYEHMNKHTERLVGGPSVHDEERDIEEPALPRLEQRLAEVLQCRRPSTRSVPSRCLRSHSSSMALCCSRLTTRSPLSRYPPGRAAAQPDVPALELPRPPGYGEQHEFGDVDSLHRC